MEFLDQLNIAIFTINIVISIANKNWHSLVGWICALLYLSLSVLS